MLQMLFVGSTTELQKMFEGEKIVEFFRKGLEEVITLPAPHIPDEVEVKQVAEIVATRTEKDVQSVMDHDRVPYMQYKKFVINMD